MGTMSKYEAEQLFGLSGEYTRADLRREYRTLMKVMHPDAVAASGENDVGTATRRAANINSAYSLLDGLFDGRDDITMKCDEHPSDRGNVSSTYSASYSSSYSASTASAADSSEADSSSYSHSEPEHAYGSSHTGAYEDSDASYNVTGVDDTDTGSAPVAPKWYYVAANFFNADIMWRIFFIVLCMSLFMDSAHDFSSLPLILLMFFSFFHFFAPVVTNAVRKLGFKLIDSISGLDHTHYVKTY